MALNNTFYEVKIDDGAGGSGKNADGVNTSLLKYSVDKYLAQSEAKLKEALSYLETADFYCASGGLLINGENYVALRISSLYSRVNYLIEQIGTYKTSVESYINTPVSAVETALEVTDAVVSSTPKFTGGGGGGRFDATILTDESRLMK